MEPFLIIGMPRSRTAWLANFFTWEDAICLHGGLRNHKSVADLFEALKKPGAARGDADPTLTLFPTEVIEESPSFRIAYVVRDLKDVWNSSTKAYRGTATNPETFVTASELGFRMLRKYAPSMEIPYESLDDEAAMYKLWKHILPTTPFPVERFHMLKTINIQEDFAKAAILRGTN